MVEQLEAITNTNAFQVVKTLINEGNERELATITALNGDQIRYDPSQTSKGVSVSPPKKSFLIRSQSHTEPTSPLQNNSNLSQSQKTNTDNSISNTQNGLEADVESMNDSLNHHFTRSTDLISITHSNGVIDQQFKPTIDNRNDQHLNSLIRINQNGHPHPMIKQQTVVVNNKRPFGKLILFSFLPFFSLIIQ